GAAARTRSGRARLPRETDQPASGAREDQALGGGGPVTSLQFLWVVAVAQGVLLVALIILIILNRWFRLRPSARLQPRRRALDDGTGTRRRGGAGPGASAGVAGRRRARHVVRPRAGRAVARPVAVVGQPVVDTRAAHQQPVGPLVEAARVRSLPLCSGDTAR